MTFLNFTSFKRFKTLQYVFYSVLQCRKFVEIQHRLYGQALAPVSFMVCERVNSFSTCLFYLLLQRNYQVTLIC